MITPRLVNQVRAALLKHGLVPQDFDLVLNKDSLRLNYLKDSFYFSVIERQRTKDTSVIARVVDSMYSYNLKYYPGLLSDLSVTSNAYNQPVPSWAAVISQLSLWLAWIKKEYGPFEILETHSIDTASDPPPLTHLHPTIQQVASSLFATNHYPQAIQSACTALEKAIQQKGGQSASITGTTLISKVFPKDNPIISLSDDQGEREGYGFLYRGLLQAIRNHYAHNLTEIPAPRALEWLSFISALFYKLDESQPATSENSAA